MTGVAGGALLGLGLLAGLLRANLRERRFFDRPALARNRWFDPLLNLVRWGLLAGALALLWRGAPAAAAAAAAVLLAAWAWRRAIRSVWFQRRLLRRDYEELRRARPGAAESDILIALTMRRHPRWGEELIQQIVLDYPDFNDLARIIARMERGFRGFR